MVFSGSSGKSDCSQAPVELSTVSDFAARDPIGPLLVRNQPGEEQKGDDDDQQTARQSEQETKGAVECADP